MSVVVIVPWWPASPPERQHALALVHDYYRSEFPNWLFLLGLDHSALFSRGRAVNRAADNASRAWGYDPETILVCNDADSLVSPDQVRYAVERARLEREKVKAYTRYRRISTERSAAIDDYREALAVADADIAWEQTGAQSHGVVAFPLGEFVRIGGYDPRFEGWGADDLALDALWDTLSPHSRIPGDLVHLDHPPDPASLAEHENFEQNGRIQHRYQSAAGNADELQAIRLEAGWPC